MAAKPAWVLLVVGVSGTSLRSVSIGTGVVALIGDGCVIGLAVVLVGGDLGPHGRVV